MKRILFILFLCCIGSGLAACQDEDHTVPTLPSGNDPEINDPVVEFYDWEKNRLRVTDIYRYGVTLWRRTSSHSLYMG